MAITARRTESNVDVQPVRQIRVQEQDVSSGIQNIAGSLEQGSNALSRIAIERKVEDDDTAVLERFNTAQEQAEQRFNGENGFNRLEGKLAAGAMAEADTYLEESKQANMESLENDSQRKKFSALMDKSDVGRRAKLNNHVENEREKYRQNVLSTTVTTEYGRAVNNPGDEETRQDALFNAELALREKFKGQDEKFINAKMLELKQGMNQNILLQLVEEDYKQAEDFLRANYDDVTVEARNTIESKIKKKKNDIKAFQKTDEITSKYADEGDALLAVQKIKDPATRKTVQGNVTNHYANQSRVALKRRTEQTNTAWNHLIDFNDQGEVNGVNSVINAQEDAKVQTAMRNYIGTMNKGQAPTTKPEVYSQMLEVGRENPDGLQLALDQNKDNLSLTDYKKFADMANENLEKRDKVIKSAISENQQLKSVAMGAGFKVGAKASANQTEMYNSYALQYEQEKTAFVEREKRDPNYGERDKIMRKLMAEHVTDKGFFYDDTARFFELTDEQQAPIEAAARDKVTYDMTGGQLMKLSPDRLSQLTTSGVNMKAITPTQINSLSSQLTNQGLAVTDENIKAMYIHYLQGRN